MLAAAFLTTCQTVFSEMHNQLYFLLENVAVIISSITL